MLAADAVKELLAFGVRKPVILTETGGVKPRHTGASELYEKDKDGVLLHDLLFAPFFAGAAGPGHVWFWRQAIDRPNHWHHFQRFNRALEGVDPPAEAFEPIPIEMTCCVTVTGNRFACCKSPAVDKRLTEDKVPMSVFVRCASAWAKEAAPRHITIINARKTFANIVIKSTQG